MNWTNIFLVILGIFIAWWLYRGIKRNPQAFSKENLGKSFYTMAILALLLIGFIWLLVVLLRS